MSEEIKENEFLMPIRKLKVSQAVYDMYKKFDESYGTAYHKMMEVQPDMEVTENGK